MTASSPTRPAAQQLPPRSAADENVHLKCGDV
jgi:hypothetical protein